MRLLKGALYELIRNEKRYMLGEAVQKNMCIIIPFAFEKAIYTYV